MADIASLHKNRRFIKGRITKFTNFLVIEDNTEENEFNEIEDAYFSVVGKARRIHKMVITEKSTLLPGVAAVMTSSAIPKIILPELGLPTFDGNIENWLSFYGKFTTR